MYINAKVMPTNNTDYRYHVIAITQTRVYCLICTHNARRCTLPKDECGLLGNARVPVLQLICYTSGTLKICPNLCSMLQHYFYIAWYNVYLWVITINVSRSLIRIIDVCGENTSFISRMLYCKLDSRI